MFCSFLPQRRSSVCSFGNFVKQLGTDRIAKTMENELLNIVSILLPRVGSQMTRKDHESQRGWNHHSRSGFLCCNCGWCAHGQANLFLKEKINPLIAPPCGTHGRRVSSKVGLNMTWAASSSCMPWVERCRCYRYRNRGRCVHPTYAEAAARCSPGRALIRVSSRLTTDKAVRRPDHLNVRLSGDQIERAAFFQTGHVFT